MPMTGSRKLHTDEGPPDGLSDPVIDLDDVPPPSIEELISAISDLEERLYKFEDLIRDVQEVSETVRVLSDRVCQLESAIRMAD